MVFVSEEFSNVYSTTCSYNFTERSFVVFNMAPYPWRAADKSVVAQRFISATCSGFSFNPRGYLMRGLMWTKGGAKIVKVRVNAV